MASKARPACQSNLNVPPAILTTSIMVFRTLQASCVPPRGNSSEGGSAKVAVQASRVSSYSRNPTRQQHSFQLDLATNFLDCSSPEILLPH